MCFDDAGDVGHAAVADLHCVPVEYLVQFGFLWKVFVDQLWECSADVCCHVAAEWGVEPDDVALSVPFFLRGLFVKVGDAFCVPA